jgi:HK97 family phage major capsid protein
MLCAESTQRAASRRRPRTCVRFKVAKGTRRATWTITLDNITAMWRRLPAPMRRSVVRLVAEDQLDYLTTPIGGVPPVYLPAGVGDSGPLLKGRPLITVEQAAPLGTVGDIVLADLNGYVLLNGQMQSAISADVAFTTDQTV